MTRKCPACKIDNEDAQWRCGGCGTILINEREVVNKIPKCYSINDKTDFIGFFKKNSTLFVVLGVFAALSFYLTTIVSNKGNYRILLFQNISNFDINSYYGNISLINDPLQNPSWTGVNSITALQIGLTSSFVIFFIVLFVITYELMKIDSNMKWVLFIFLDFLVTAILFYLVNMYIIQIVIIALMLLSVVILSLYFGNFLLLKGGYDNDKSGKWTFFKYILLSGASSFIIILELGYIFTDKVIILFMTNFFGDLLTYILFLIVPFLIVGITAGIILTVFLFQINSVKKLKI